MPPGPKKPFIFSRLNGTPLALRSLSSFWEKETPTKNMGHLQKEKEMSLQRSLTGTFLALGLGLAILGSASAQSDTRGMRGGHFGGSWSGHIGGGDMGRGGWDNPRGSEDRFRVSEEVRQFFSGESTLKVKQLLSLGQHRGMELKKVILVAETRAGRGTAELVINGHSETFPERVGTQIENVDLKPRSSGLIIGRDINTLQIHLKGQFYVERVIAVLEEPYVRPGPGPGPIPGQVARKYISQSFRGFETLPLRALMDLDRDYRGMNIAKVVVTGESIYGHSQARLMVNGSQVGHTETFSRYRRDLEFILPNSSDTLGDEIRTLQLDLTGEIYIESIEVHFERRGPRPGPGPGPSDRLDRAPRMPLRGAHALNLIDVMNASVFDGRREVSRVDIVVSGANQRAALALCSNTVRGQVCDTEEDLSYGRRTSITLDVRGRTALKDLILMSKGALTLERISVHFR